MSGFGNLVAYEQRAPRTNEVYCVELVISNPGTLVVGPDGKLTPTFTRTDMLEVFGRLVAENTYKYYDVRAVCVDAFPAETGFTVWVVVTSNDPTVVIESWRQDPEELRNRINLDTRFTSRFPAGRVSALQWLQIVPPPAGIVEEWLGFPIIWDKRLSPPKGAPTAEWASGDDSVWTGKPDWQTGIGGGDLKKTRWKPTVVPPVGPGIPGPSPADIARCRQTPGYDICQSTGTCETLWDCNVMTLCRTANGTPVKLPSGQIGCSMAPGQPPVILPGTETPPPPPIGPGTVTASTGKSNTVLWMLGGVAAIGILYLLTSEDPGTGEPKK